MQAEIPIQNASPARDGIAALPELRGLSKPTDRLHQGWKVRAKQLMEE
ncbi:MAG: hypothetical protein ABIJ57_00915 [Pseudomonadota bacterium]